MFGGPPERFRRRTRDKVQGMTEYEPPDRPFCVSCAAFSPTSPSAEVGECRHNPPVLVALGGEVTSCFPQVGGGDWCDEHDPVSWSGGPTAEVPAEGLKLPEASTSPEEKGEPQESEPRLVVAGYGVEGSDRVDLHCDRERVYRVVVGEIDMMLELEGGVPWEALRWDGSQLAGVRWGAKFSQTHCVVTHFVDDVTCTVPVRDGDFRQTLDDAVNKMVALRTARLQDSPDEPSSPAVA